MIGHIGINVPDLVLAKAYYDELMPLVGMESFFCTDDEFSYRPAGAKPGTFVFFYPSPEAETYASQTTGLQHLAFMVKQRNVVDEIHAHVVSKGGHILEEPKEFPQYGPAYYATFWLDPHGFMLEAVCHRSAG